MMNKSFSRSLTRSLNWIEIASSQTNAIEFKFSHSSDPNVQLNGILDECLIQIQKIIQTL